MIISSPECGGRWRRQTVCWFAVVTMTLIPNLFAGTVASPSRITTSAIRVEALSRTFGAILLHQPSRLELRPTSRDFSVGAITDWEILLRSANGRQVPAVSSFDVFVGTGDSPETKVEFPRQARSINVRLPMRRAGLVTVHARSKGLAAATATAYVRAPSVAGEPQALQLVLNSGKALANGRDFVRVQAIIMGDPPAAPVTIRLVCVNADLEPELLQIPKGGLSAEARLVSGRSGRAVVEAITSTPRMEIKNPKLFVDFVPDLHPALTIDPTNIWVLEQAQLSVTLLDSAGKVVKAKEPHKVSLSLRSGHPGELEANSLMIEPEESVAYTRFSPYWAGKAQFSASMADSVPLNATLEVSTPWPVIWLSLCCGAVGGLIAARRQNVPKGEFWWRVMTGAVTGFVLFVASAFGLLLGGLRGLSVHMMGALVVSILGGYLGTEVFTLLLKRLHLVSEDPHDVPGRTTP